MDLKGEKRCFQIDEFASSYPRLFRVSESTKIIIGKPGTKRAQCSAFKIDREGLEGLSDQIDEINRILRDYGPQTSFVELPLWHRPIQGMLIYGPKGTGKSLLVDKMASCGWARVFHLTSEKLRSATERFDTAIGSCLLIVSDLESIAPARSSDGRSNLSAQLRELYVKIRGSKTLIVAEARHPNSIDESLRTISRFGSEIEISVPNASGRRQILRNIRDTSDQPSDDLLDDIASRTHGYVGADLFALMQVTLRVARDRQEKFMEITESLDGAHIREERYDEKRPPTDSEKSPNGASNASHDSTPPKSFEPLTILAEDITAAMSKVRPSAMQEIFLETPDVRWCDIGGQREIKERLQLAIEEPLTMAGTMARFNLKPEKGVLLYGPPGCSKTMLVKALATEAGLNFLAVKGAETVSMYVGESERSIREIFRKARAASPSIVFFDEFDAIAASNRKSELKVLETLLNEMDGFEELRNVFVVAATNKPEAIDPALLRPGRFDNIVYVGLPDLETRKGIIQLWFDKSVVVVDDWDLAAVAAIDDEESDTSATAVAATAVLLFASMTDGYSGAEIVNICQNAGRFAMRAKRDHIAGSDLIRALKGQPHGVTKEMLQRYEQWGKDRL